MTPMQAMEFAAIARGAIPVVVALFLIDARRQRGRAEQSQRPNRQSMGQTTGQKTGNHDVG